MRIRYSFSSRHTGHIDGSNKHKKAIPKLLKEIIDISEILVEILDARFIDETRNLEIENLIKEKKKTLIYAINKVDLVDLKSLKEKINFYPYVLVSAKKRQGIRQLRNRIKMEAKRIESDFKIIQVGIIGYPNTGKSSLINSLSGRSSAPVSSESGFTKGIKKIKLKKNLMLLDSPGLIIESENSNNNKQDLIKHGKISVKTWDKIKSPDFVLFDLMKQYPGLFEKFYGIEANGDPEMLIENLGRKRSFLKKGNLVDTDRTARAILRDWQAGKMRIKNIKIY